MHYRLHSASPVVLVVDAVEDGELLRRGEPHELDKEPPATTRYERRNKLLEVTGWVPHPGPQLEALFLRPAHYTAQITNKSFKYTCSIMIGRSMDPFFYIQLHKRIHGSSSHTKIKTMSNFYNFSTIRRSMDPFHRRVEVKKDPWIFRSTHNHVNISLV